MRELIVATAALFFLSPAPVCADDAALSNKTREDRAPKYRQAIVNAVAWLDEGGAKIERDASCINCHHAPLRRWAIHEASRAGAKAEMAALQENTTKQLKQLSEVKDDYRGRQWGHSLSAFFLLGNGDGESTRLSEEATKELSDVILAEQAADGSWKAAQQFANQRRPKGDGHQVQTLWNLLALAGIKSNESATTARDRALKWLEASEPGATIDARALRFIVEREWGKADSRQKHLEALLKTQHADGGWGWQSDDPSDAWATGLALYALSHESKDNPDDVIERGQDFLVATQKEDGSWLVEGKLTSNSKVSSYFGTVWAIIGLSRNLSTR